MEENSRKTMREGVIREELNGVLHVGFELSEDERRRRRGSERVWRLRSLRILRWRRGR